MVPPQQDGGEDWKSKSVKKTKLVGQDKESLISERENKTKQTKHNKKIPASGAKAITHHKQTNGQPDPR